MNIALLLARAAQVFPERPAVFLGSRPVLTYRELAANAASLAGFLRNGLAIAKGGRVAVFMKNAPQYLEILYAAWWAGLSIVPINAKLHPKEAAFILNDAEASALFVSEDLAADMSPLLDQAPSVRRVFIPGEGNYQAALASPPLRLEDHAPDDLAWLFYTSGTTGRPKGVMQSHRNLFAMTACYFMDVDDIDQDDAIVYAAPMSHGAGLYNFVFVAKAARHIVPASGGFDPEELAALSKTVGQLCFFAAPTMVKRLTTHMAETGGDSGGFKTIVYGGGPMYREDLLQAIATMGPKFVQIYGQGECPMTITALSRRHVMEDRHPRWLERISSVGVAHSLVEVKVVDADGAEQPVGQTGEVVVRGEPVMAGYWRDAEATAKALRGGWLWTGDLGAIDEDGFLTLKDRSKDVIISGGSNIYPREIEEVLLQHPGVHEVSVIGQVDPEWGEIVVAFVVGDGVTADVLDRLCLKHIARFKRPKYYYFISSMPKNNYGKVLKSALRPYQESMKL